MNPQWFGDSFDIVKRFFIYSLKDMGYQVYVDPMLTGEWNGLEDEFYSFLGAEHIQQKLSSSANAALFLDPDTGVHIKKQTAQHVSIKTIAGLLSQYAIVLSFDQSFSRGTDAITQMNNKLRELMAAGAHGFYYDSHARFLFAAKSANVLANLRQVLISKGLPEKRFVGAE